MRNLEIEEIYTLLKCKGRTPDCIGRNCDICKAETLNKYCNVVIKDKYLSDTNN